MHNKEYLNNAMLLFIMILVVWISFIPESIKYQFDNIVNVVLWIFLILSLFMCKFKIAIYFFDKNDIFLWVYFFLLLPNIWFAQDKNRAFIFYKDFIIVAVAIYFLVKNEVNMANAKKIFYSFCICALVVSMVGFLEMIFGKNLIYEKFVNNYYYGRFIIDRRMMSTLIHPNILGSYLVTIFPLAYYFYKSKHFLKIRILNLAIFLLIISAIILTYSRGAWLACLLMLSIWFLIKRRIKWLFLVWAIILLFSIIASSSFIGENIRSRFGLEYLWKNLKYDHRVIQYLVTKNILREHPFVGIGLDSYRILFDRYTPMNFPYEVKIPDSVYLMHLAETGFFGFLGFGIFLFNTIKRSFSYYKKLKGDNKDMFFVAMIAFIGLLFNIASYDAFLWKTSFYLFWLLAGILAALYKDSYSRVTLSHE